MTHIPNGIGIGLRIDLAQELLERKPKQVRWLEIHPENYMNRGGRYPALLRDALETWPITTHGLTNAFGNLEPAGADYLKPLRELIHEIGSPWHSDHLCFTGVEGEQLLDLLPLPLTEESIKVCSQRIIEARDALDIEIAFENVSYYAPCGDPKMEADFCVAILEQTKAKMLLDVNNVYVNSRNHGFDAEKFIDRIPADQVVEIHIAGHLERSDGSRIDTHGEPICEDVYDLLGYTLRRFGPKPVLLERDNNIPAFDEVLAEVDRLGEIYDASVGTST
jgi:uncharacterized protein (UPF0276 family)